MGVEWVGARRYVLGRHFGRGVRVAPVLWISACPLKPTSTVKDGKLIPSTVTFDSYRGIFRGDLFSSLIESADLP